MQKLLFFLLCCVGLLGLAPPLMAQGDSTALDELRTAFSTLDRSRITTEVLLDQVVAISKPHEYNGDYNAAAVNSYENWEEQYWEYFNASFNRYTLESINGIRSRTQAKLNATDTGYMRL